MKSLVLIFLFVSVSHAVTISSVTYNYLWNPFTGTEQYVTSLDTTSIQGSGVIISTINSGVLITSTATASSFPCGNSGDVQINFNGTCGGIGSGLTGSQSGGVSTIGFNNGIITSVSSTPVFALSPNTHIEISSATPIISNCGATPSGSVVGNDVAGKITVGGGIVTSCKMTFAVPWTNAPACSILSAQTITSPTGATTINDLTIGASATIAGDLISYVCLGYK